MPTRNAPGCGGILANSLVHSVDLKASIYTGLGYCWIGLDVDMEAEVGIEPAYTALQAAA